MKRLISVIIVFAILTIPIVHAEEKFASYLADFSSLSGINVDSDVVIAVDPQDEQNKVLHFEGATYKTATFAGDLDLSKPVNIEGKIYREYSEEDDPYWDFRVFLEADSSNMLAAFGKNIYIGNAWKPISVYDYDANTWLDFRIHIIKTGENIESELFLDGNSYGKITQVIPGNIKGVKMGSFTGLNNGSVYIDNVAYISESAELTNVLSQIEAGENVSKEVCNEWMITLSENAIFSTARAHYKKIFEYAVAQNYLTPGTIQFAYPQNEQEIYAGSSIKYVYEGMLDINTTPTAVVKENGTSIDGVSASVNLNTLIISAPLSADKSYTIEVSNLKAYDGSLITFTPINFTTNIIPVVNVNEGAIYEYGKTVNYTDGAGISSNLVLKKGTDTQVIQNGDIITLSGDVSLEITSIKNTTTKTHTIDFNVIGNTIPIANEVKISKNSSNQNLLTGSYEFFDYEGDLNEGTEYGFYATSDLLVDPTLITSNMTDEFLITPDVYNKYIYFGVIPKSNHLPKEGKLTLSQVYIAPFSPVAKNVRIGGTASVGETLSGYYTYFDANGDLENAQTKLEWVKTDGSVVGTGATFKIPGNFVGEEIAFRVQVQNNVDPKEGIPTTSSYVTIAPNVYLGNSGSSGGFVGANSGTPGGAKEPLKPTPTPTVPTPTVPTPSVPEEQLPDGVFTDTKDHWAKDAIKELKLKGIVTGMSDKEFAPDNPVSRAQFVAMILRAMNIKTTDYAGAFSDVNANDWFAAYVQTALNEGIISIDNNFRPNDNITREEAAKILCAFVEAGKIEYNFTDAEDISDWADEYVKIVASAGLFKGDEKGAFNPQKQMTRAEASTVLLRSLENGGIEND